MVLAKGFNLTTLLASVREVVKANQQVMHDAMETGAAAAGCRGDDAADGGGAGRHGSALAANIRSISGAAASVNADAASNPSASTASGSSENNPLQLRVAGKHPCNFCDNKYSSLWVHRGICYNCERKSRQSGTCPYGTRCKPESFCPHSKRCFRCDAWSR